MDASRGAEARADGRSRLGNEWCGQCAPAWTNAHSRPESWNEHDPSAGYLQSPTQWADVFESIVATFLPAFDSRLTWAT